VVWSPRTNIALYGNTAPVSLLKALGVPISLGTDWLPSGSSNMLRELACVDFLNQAYFNNLFSDKEIWELATSNAAQAVGAYKPAEDKYIVGAIEVGATADLSVFDGRKQKEYRAAIAASNEDVLLVMRGGKILFGEAKVVADASTTPESCERFDLCGTKKRACIKGDAKIKEGEVTLAALAKLLPNTGNGTVYGLYTCRGETPKMEPTCTPYRSEYPNGTSATDGDGDGVPDAEDNCPKVFNPARPMDTAGQADADGDKVGDACDATPNGP
jgi:hypothetical protein